MSASVLVIASASRLAFAGDTRPDATASRSAGASCSVSAVLIWL